MNTPTKVVIGIVVLAAIGLACGQGSSRLGDCDALRPSIVELSERDRTSRGFSLIKIYEPTEVSRTETELSCKGEASWSDGDKTAITYKSTVDSEGDVMIEYKVPQ